jgi:hypothetical protein
MGTIQVVELSGGTVRWLYVAYDGRLHRAEERAKNAASAPILETMQYEYAGDRVATRRTSRSRSPVPGEAPDGVTRYEYGRDRVECAFFDLRGAPAARGDHVHRIGTLYGDGKLPVRAEYANSDGALVNNGGGYAVVVVRTKEGRVSSLTFQDVEGKPVEARFRDTPAAIVRYEALRGIEPLYAEHCLTATGDTSASRFYATLPTLLSLCECGVDARGKPLQASDCDPLPPKTKQYIQKRSY